MLRNSGKIQKILKENQKFHIGMCKQILGVHRYVNKMKVLAELSRTPPRIKNEK